MNREEAAAEALPILSANGYRGLSPGDLMGIEAPEGWECFDDEMVSFGWMVRPIGERTYGQGFTLDRGGTEYAGEAAATRLRDLLNIITKENA